MAKLDKKTRKQAEKLFKQLAKAQDAMWTAANELEELLDCEIDSEMDYRKITLEEALEMGYGDIEE